MEGKRGGPEYPNRDILGRLFSICPQGGKLPRDKAQLQPSVLQTRMGIAKGTDLQEFCGKGFREAVTHLPAAKALLTSVPFLLL